MSSDTEVDDRKPPPSTTPTTRRTASDTGRRTTNIEQQTDVSATIPSDVVPPKFGFVQGLLPVLGGPPDPGFTCSLSVVAASPFCTRDPNPRHAERSFQRRVEGLDPKFSPTATDYRLVELADLAFNHCILHGIDTPFYQADPADATRIVELFHSHGKFSFNDVKEHIDKMIHDGVFDQYMLTALNDSAAFLLNSLDRTFQRTIRTSLLSDESRYGPLVWMKIVEDVLPNTLRRMDELEAQFRERSVKNTPGENVNVWAQAQLETLMEMDSNDQLPRDHLLALQRQLTTCSVEAFRMFWHTKLDTLSDFVRLSAGKAKEVAKSLKGYTTYRILLQQAKDSYSNLKDDWGPAKGNVSSTAAHTAALKSLKAEIKSLKSQFGNADNKSSSSKQPKEKKSGGSTSGKTSSSSGSGGNGGKKSEGSSAETRWNRIAPKDGEPTTISKYGKSFYWCAKCKRWTQTHGTDQHQSKDEKTDAAKPAPPAAHFAAQAWTAPLTAGWGSDSDSE
jgi:hypothetical protein